MITKKLAINVGGNDAPYTYSWSSDCAGITFSNATGTLVNDGVLETNITFDETVCKHCTFTISLSSATCTSTRTKNIYLSCGKIEINYKSATTSTGTLKVNNVDTYTVANNTSFVADNLLYGKKDMEMTFTCPSTKTASLVVNGKSYIGPGNNTFKFTNTTEFDNPHIVIDCQCL